MHSFSIYDFYLLLKQAFQINLINNTKMSFTTYKKIQIFRLKLELWIETLASILEKK